MMKQNEAFVLVPRSGLDTSIGDLCQKVTSNGPVQSSMHLQTIFSITLYTRVKTHKSLYRAATTLSIKQNLADVRLLRTASSKLFDVSGTSC